MNAQRTRVKMERPASTVSTRRHASVLKDGLEAHATQVGFFLFVKTFRLSTNEQKCWVQIIRMIKHWQHG